MKKIILVVLAMLSISAVHASRLSVHMHKMEAEQQAAERREWQQDMNFADLAFRLDHRYTDDRGRLCRDYMFRSKSNPYRVGTYRVCEERYAGFDNQRGDTHYHR